MGKQASKHAECFLVNARLNKALEEQILKQTKTTGFNLANYNLNQSISELSISIEDNSTGMPLRVELPPQKMDTDASKILAFDQAELDKKEKGEKGDNKGDNRLNIEEFECGVKFGGTDNKKQEWSFTLYDFDGHGKITKEDLASLLKALYDAVGSSIKIPSNGTKTLKLRLTVGQDGSQLPGNRTSPLKVKDCGKEKVKDISKSKDSPKSKEFSKLNNLTRTHVQMPVKCNNESKGQSSTGVNPTSCQGQGVNHTSCQGQGVNQRSCQGQGVNHTSCQGQGANQGSCPGQSCNKRIQLTSQEQQELAELVQENMERNHIKQLRRHHSDCKGTTKEHSNHKRRHRGHKNNNTSAPVDVNINNHGDQAKECQDRRNYYLDLAGIEHNAITKCQSFTNNAISQGQTAQPHGNHHHRSRSQDTNQKCDNIRRETECLNVKHEQQQAAADTSAKHDHIRSRSFDPQETVVRSPKGHHKSAGSSPHKHGRFRPVSLPMHIPDAVSAHYHRRHRHREKDHDLAMQQVAEWIEREHTCDMDGDRIVVQRHEHHHVHEHHHHHHYHHYYEA